MVTDKRAEPTWVAAVLRGGVDDYCALEGWSHAELAERLRIQWQNKQSRDLLHHLRLDQERLRLRARTDSLTGALGRAAMAQVLRQRFRARQQYAVIFADLDHFKSVNDRYGHQVGDVVLREVAQALAKACGPQDACGRYGGEEFLLVLGNAGNARALAVAENLREAIRCLNFSGSDGPERVTASFGVAVFNPSGIEESEHSILHRADVALYQAKTEGRDRVVLASPAGSGEMRIPTTAELESERVPLVPTFAFARERTPR
jgi:diguanylate cyclase (GGDEF)-like protein